MSVQYYDMILKNTTSSGININDLSGLYIPASGTRDITDLFPFQRLIYSEDLDTLISGGEIVLNVEGYDLPVDYAQVFLSHHNATHIQGIPIGGNSTMPHITNTLSGGYIIEYDADDQKFDFNEFKLSNLRDVDVNTDGTFMVHGATNNYTPPKNFISLFDAPTTYSGYSGAIPVVNLTEDGLIFSEYTPGTLYTGNTPPASGTTNIWYRAADATIYYYDDDRDDWLSVVTHTYLFTYNASIGAAYMSVGSVANSFAHYSITRPATIISIIAHGDSGNATKTFYMEDHYPATPTTLKTFSMTDYEYVNMDENIDINNGAELKIYVGSDGQGIKYPIIQVQIKWRYEA